MEFLNGSDALRIIRKIQHNKKIGIYHIVSITAFDGNETKNNILTSGVNSILTKPCTKTNIANILNSIFNG